MAAPVQATVTTALAGANNDLIFTSRWNAGKAVSIVYLDPGAINYPGQVDAFDVAGVALIVVLLRRAAGAIAMTAAEIITAIRANPLADSLVDVQNAAANDGTGAVIALALTALAGGVDPTFATQTEAETKYRSIAWAANNYQSECFVGGAQQKVISVGTEAAHRALLDRHYIELSRRGKALDRI